MSLVGVSVTLMWSAKSHLTARFTATCLVSLQLIPGFAQPGRWRQRSLGQKIAKVRLHLKKKKNCNHHTRAVGFLCNLKRGVIN